MNPAELETMIPGEHPLPRPFADICKYPEAHGTPISGCFELSTLGTDDLQRWFSDDSSAHELLVPFGRGACGNVYALWLTDDLTPENAPVVMLGSEGELDVLARDPEQFCRLLCLGYSEVGLVDPASPPTNFDEAERFRRFMLERYNFALPPTALPIVEEARARFPSFRSWVADQLSGQQA